MRWLTNFNDFRFKWTAAVGIGIHPTKAWLSQLVNFKNAIWHHLVWIEHQFLSGLRDSRMMRGVGGVRKSIHQSSLAKGLGLGLLCWGFKGVQEEIPSEEASILQIVSVASPLGQCISPQFHPCHRLFDLSSEAVVMRQLRRWKRLWRRSWTCSHKRTSMGFPDVVGTVQQVHCSRRRLLGRGLQFHGCTINKSAHTKKVWKLI